ncbi:MAG: hemerythrin domain-containing protein [Candidatus Micrarchaeota archaeon]|nr:hemerythrin domain-containing protein [Candidatus Micrarchaeota archaeon]
MKKIESSISLFMVKDHALIYSFLHEYFQEKNLQRKILARRRFLRLLWRLKTHFDWEELLLFPHLKEKNSKDIKQLINEHQEIKQLLKVINDKTENDDFSTEKEEKELEKLLKRHSEFEDKKLYPKLDKKLNEKEKKKLIEEMISQIATDY